MRSQISNPESPSGFTLIELLVVVTIIVVLIALLAPALDRAIYQAELAKCGGGMRGIATGEVQYAFNNKRHYSDRPAARTAENTNYQPKQLSGTGSVGNTGNPGGFFDERPLLRPYMNVDAFVCPPAGSISVDKAHPKTTLFMPYIMFYSYQYRVAGATAADPPPKQGGGMFRIGDKLNWQGHRFDTIVADGAYIGAGTQFGSFIDVAAHPDSKGLGDLSQSQFQDTQEATFSTSSGDPETTRTQAGWGGPLKERVRFDFNFGHDDGSVRRINDIHWRLDNSGVLGNPREERLRPVPTNIVAPAQSMQLTSYYMLPR